MSGDRPEGKSNVTTKLGDVTTLDSQMEQLDSGLNGLLSNIEALANVSKDFLRPPTPQPEDEDVVEESLIAYSEQAKRVKRFIGIVAQANYQLAQINSRFDQGVTA